MITAGEALREIIEKIQSKTEIVFVEIGKNEMSLTPTGRVRLDYTTGDAYAEFEDADGWGGNMWYTEPGIDGALNYMTSDDWSAQKAALNITSNM